MRRFFFARSLRAFCGGTVKVVSLVLFVSLIAACAKEYVGRRVSYGNSFWCQFHSLPHNCTQVDDWLTIKYDLKTSGNGRYLLIGEMHYKGSTGFSSISTRSHPDYPPSRFMLILANGGVIVDQIAFTPQSYDLSSTIPFERKFESQTPFDAAMIYYQMTVRD